jgi:hypothetical protein
MNIIRAAKPSLTFHQAGRPYTYNLPAINRTGCTVLPMQFFGGGRRRQEGFVRAGVSAEALIELDNLAI